MNHGDRVKHVADGSGGRITRKLDAYVIRWDDPRAGETVHLEDVLEVDE